MHAWLTGIAEGLWTSARHCLTIKDCFHTLSAVRCGVEGSESVETISWAEPLRGGWGYGD